MRITLAALAASTLGVVAASAGPAASDSSGCAPPLIGVGAIGEGRNDPSLMPPTVGELRILLLFVDFLDLRGRRAPWLQYEEAVPKLREWYSTVSYGRLRIEADLVPRWVTLRHELAYYEHGAGDVFGEVVAAVDPEVDFSRIDAIYVTSAHDAGAGWVVIADRPLVVDGKPLRAIAWNALGAAAHETGHVLGLPDLYVGGVPWTFYRWDVMAGGTRESGLYVWHRWKLGWLDPRQIACLQARGRIEATVTPVERAGGVKAVVVRTRNVAYVAEVRQRVAEDATICKTGVLVYEVDLSGSRRPIWLYAAKPDGSISTGACGGRWRAPFDVGPGQVSTMSVGGVRFELLSKLGDGSYRIRATRRR
jgi:M6 family metalloprotease-like protein